MHSRWRGDRRYGFVGEAIVDTASLLFGTAAVDEIAGGGMIAGWATPMIKLVIRSLNMRRERSSKTSIGERSVTDLKTWSVRAMVRSLSCKAVSWRVLVNAAMRSSISSSRSLRLCPTTKDSASSELFALTVSRAMQLIGLSDSELASICAMRAVVPCKVASDDVGELLASLLGNFARNVHD